MADSILVSPTVVNVELGERSYPIYIGRQLLQQGELLRRHLRGQQVLIVTNETVAPLYLSQCTAAFGERTVGEVILPDGEAYKSLEMTQRVFDELMRLRFNRQCTVVALGGGVIGDLAGFAAACYQRGVDFIQLPTTLLAQVDSSVGGKTGVNHPLGKNMIGAFHQPRCVVIDTDTLATLPPKELRAGLAEVIKYGLIADLPFFEWLEQHLDALLAREPGAIAEAIARCCQNKAAIVAQDERESGMRALLNLGHTFGHAIETAMGYGAWLHGQAVAAGIAMAAELSCRRGWLTQEEVARVTALLQRARLPIEPPPLPRAQWLALMASDKKALDHQLRFVLLRRLGEGVVSADVTIPQLESLLSYFGASAAA